jgi:hypothetical protein
VFQSGLKTSMTSEFTRPLEPTERNILQELLEQERTSSVSCAGTYRVVIFWLMVMLMSVLQASAVLISRSHPTAFFFAVVSPLAIGVFALGLAVMSVRKLVRCRRSQRRTGSDRMSGILEEALGQGLARVARIEPPVMVKLEPFESEGEGYFFEVDTDRVMFMTGTELDPVDRLNWPSSAIEVAFAANFPLRIQVHCVGPKMQTVEVIQAQSRNPGVGRPGDGEILKGSLREVISQFLLPATQPEPT